eukprot:4376630-Pyramimonas_sp.AAC.1
MEEVIIPWSLRRLSGSNAASWAALAWIESPWAAREGRLMNVRSMVAAAKSERLERAGSSV